MRNNSIGKQWRVCREPVCCLRREEFEGVTDRDDGQNRGVGDTTIEEDFSEDEDDDGKADGRLHLTYLN